MAKIQLATMGTFLLAFLPCQALKCTSESRCCSKEEAGNVGKQLVASILTPSVSETSQTPAECWASSEGEYGERSAAPWRYWYDWNPDRYPEYIRQAYCSCHYCISLNHTGESKRPGGPKNYTRRAVHGISSPVNFTTLVFIRKPCPADPDRYYLQPTPFDVNVSCACLAK
ncbi:hypothetical protein lerEdw1_010177 [Lerista edwardsae]|nr:hypothetical protein lerEdw1_010177 [Lerista edwardsae]